MPYIYIYIYYLRYLNIKLGETYQVLLAHDRLHRFLRRFQALLKLAAPSGIPGALSPGGRRGHLRRLGKPGRRRGDNR